MPTVSVYRIRPGDRLEADAADVAEQEQPVDDADLDAPAALDYPLEADAADVAEQHREIPLDEEGAR
jgi:hypothetical protein